jgi:hypothetical protein
LLALNALVCALQIGDMGGVGGFDFGDAVFFSPLSFRWLPFLARLRLAGVRRLDAVVGARLSPAGRGCAPRPVTS